MTKTELKKYFEKNAVTDVWKNDFMNVLTKVENEMHGAVLFYSINKILPNVLTIEDFEAGELFDNFLKEFNVDKGNIIKTEYYNPSEDILEIGYVNLILTKEILIKYKPNSYGAMIYYSNTINQEILNYFKQEAKRFAVKIIDENSLYILCDDNGRLSMWKTRTPQLKTIDIALSYGDELIELNDAIVSRLSTHDESGILILHGVPGTGKSSYIRYLMGRVKKRFLYVPTEYTHYLGSKEFMRLLIDHRNTILVVEDAENAIKQRSGNSGSATANLLNLSDGLLSDALSIQIILTFNTELSNIDPAILRKGRVIFRHQFCPLSVVKSQKLSDSLGYKTKIEKEMTLAEIYNQEDGDFMLNNKKAIGFSLNGK